MSDIKLPPLPECEATIRDFGDAYASAQMQDYALQCVLADRADRVLEVPDGWKLVPREPTSAMILTGKHTIKGCDSSFESIQAEMAYRSMVSASPTLQLGADDE